MNGVLQLLPTFIAGLLTLGIIIAAAEALRKARSKALVKAALRQMQKENADAEASQPAVSTTDTGIDTSTRAEREVSLKIKRLVPTIVPKKVKVVVVQKDGFLEDVCRFDGEFIHCGKLKMQFVAPSNYKPKPTLYKNKLYLTFFYTEDGKPLELELDEDKLKTDVKVPDPRMTEVIVNRKLLQQVFRALGSNIGAIVTGIGLGAMILAIVIFFILPLVGVPVMIGRQPVEIVHIYQQTPAGAPPPGNYTPVVPPGG